MRVKEQASARDVYHFNSRQGPGAEQGLGAGSKIMKGTNSSEIITVAGCRGVDTDVAGSRKSMCTRNALAMNPRLHQALRTSGWRQSCRARCQRRGSRGSARR